MLGKLIKYDLKSAARIFILLHAVYLFICFMARFFYMNRLSFRDVTEPLVLSLVLFFSLMTLLISALMIFTWMQVAFGFIGICSAKKDTFHGHFPSRGRSICGLRLSQVIS